MWYFRLIRTIPSFPAAAAAAAENKAEIPALASELRLKKAAADDGVVVVVVMRE